MKDWEMEDMNNSQNKLALGTQLTRFEGFSNKIQFVCTFRQPNTDYPMKKYINLNSIMSFGTYKLFLELGWTREAHLKWG